MKRTAPAAESAASLRWDYILAAAYWWFRAEGPDETLVSALNRVKATSLQQRLLLLNIPLPTPEEIHAHAAQRWPAHKIHGLQEAQ